MTAGPTKYHRVLLKLSGEALLGGQPFGISPQYVGYLAQEIRKVHDANGSSGWWLCPRWHWW